VLIFKPSFKPDVRRQEPSPQSRVCLFNHPPQRDSCFWLCYTLEKDVG